MTTCGSNRPLGARRRGPGCDAGSGSVLAIAVIASVVAVTLMLVPLTQALVLKQRVVAAADAAALAAADTASGALAGFPCAAAEKAARLNGARVGRCEIDGLIATVSAVSSYWGLNISVLARAGPPGATG